mmetsp:Transcript_9902/g.30711  ORF Transcript_9902/g.30711 Transcript_9902/m.30711 type:complete len:92 (-) Transcript_9902:239-514(-)
MKDAKREAEVVINNIHAEKDATFGLSNIETQNKDEFDDITRLAEGDIGKMMTQFEANARTVTQLLAKATTSLTLELPETRKLSGQRASGRS